MHKRQEIDDVTARNGRKKTSDVIVTWCGAALKAEVIFCVDTRITCKHERLWEHGECFSSEKGKVCELLLTSKPETNNVGNF